MVQNRLPCDIPSGKTYQHVHNRPYGDFRFFGLQLGLDHDLGCVQSRLRLNPSLTPFSCFKCCKSAKNRFFFISHRPQTINNVKKRPKDCFCAILSNLDKVDFFFPVGIGKFTCRYLQFFHEFLELNRTFWSKNLKSLLFLYFLVQWVA